MASESDYSGFDFSQYDKEVFGQAVAPTLKDGFKEDARIVLDDLSNRSTHLRSRLAESGLRVLEATYFREYLCRQLSVTTDRALTLASMSEDILIQGEDLEGPLHATGMFTGLTFIQIAQFNFEPVIGMEMGEYQIVNGDRPEVAARRLLVPIPDVGAHKFE